MTVRSKAQPIGLDLTGCKGYIQTWRERRPGRGYLDPKDAPADIFVEREKRQVHRSPGIFREQRIVELDNSPRQHRDLSPSQPRRSSRSANPHRREMVLARKGMLGFHDLIYASI